MAEAEPVTQAGVRRIFVILNPIAGHSSAEKIRQVIDRKMGELGWSYEVYETTGKENVAEIARQACAEAYDLLVAAGGDGTVAGVVNGLVHNRVPLGIIPVGTGNGLARALGIPFDPERALALLTGEHVLLPIDAMQVGDKHYILNVSAGISARAMRRTPPEVKRRFGILAYLWTIVGEAVGFRPRRFNLVVDGQRVQVHATEILITNGFPFQETPLIPGPREHFNDGVFDVALISARSLLDYLRVIVELIVNPRSRERELSHLKVRESIRIEAAWRPQPVQADGEVVGYTPVEVRIVPSAVQVIVPPEKSA